MVAEIAAKVEDENHETWSAVEKLQAIDAAAQHLFVAISQQYEDYELDFVDLTRAANGTALSSTRTRFTLPDFIYRVRLIENLQDADNPIKVPYRTLGTKDSDRVYPLSRGSHVWHWERRGGLRPTIVVVGESGNFTTLRIWYIRRLPPLHYGTAAPHATASQMKFGSGSNVTGRVLLRDSAYVGALVEFTNNDPSGIQDRVAVIESYARVSEPAGAYVCTLDNNLGGLLVSKSSSPTATTTYALVPQIESEHHELVVVEAAVRLLEDVGGEKQIATLSAKHTRLLDAFRVATDSRQQQTSRSVEVSTENY
jgi:hypothetical protein